MAGERSKAVRALFMLGAASGALFTMAPAQAQAMGGAGMIVENAPHRLGVGLIVEDAPNIVVAAPGTPTTALDTTDVNGVGQMFVAAGGGIGTCTGSLINPRTVIFAAHCVNDRSERAYGSEGGGVPIAFGFKANNLTGVREWFLPTIGGAPNTSQFRTKLQNLVFNVEQVRWHADSLLNPAALGFIEADVAIAALDTPARGVPTWSLLFTALGAPTSISETAGTGYEVKVTGYGRTGNPLQGAVTSVDWRRRSAENYLGFLGSLNDRNQFLFGATFGQPQNLYQLDFDDPTRQYPFDFNLFKDDARPNEGTTGPGDSGGPLILTRRFAEDVVIGVLSGGSRFFGPQPFSAYGTSSFYQPLYLFWDWIAENNPYRYVSARSGDGNWEDASRWVSLQDPAYRIINSSGNLVVGTPTQRGDGRAGNDPNKFGQVCFFNQCYDVKTGQIVLDGQPVQADNVSVPLSNGQASDSGRTLLAGLDAPIGRETVMLADQPNADGVSAVSREQAQNGGPPVLPAPTIQNGLPGASGFVPNNVRFNRTTGINARYFDVNLSAGGTTTLSSQVEIDKLTISGATAGLTIASSGSLSVIQDIQQLRGAVTVNGRLATNNDYLLLTGFLSGSGTVSTPFFTSVAGVISPGTTGTIGTLTIQGNAILASGTALLIDLGANGLSDRVSVVAGANQPGLANIGGTVAFAPVAGHRLRAGDTYTILSAQGGLTGTFGGSLPAFSAILSPQLIYSANAVQMRIAARPYETVIDRNSPIQTAFAGLLDRNRGNASQLPDLYLNLDLQNEATIRSQLEAMAPRTMPLERQMGTVMMDSFSRFLRDRLTSAFRGDQGGTIAMYGQPFQVASAAAVMQQASGAVASDVGAAPIIQESKLPDTMAIYLAGGYIEGSGAGLPQATPGGRNAFSGFYLSGGVEKVTEASTLGAAFSYSEMAGATPAAGQQGDAQLFQGTLYGAAWSDKLMFDAQASVGHYKTQTQRQIAIGPAAMTLTGGEKGGTALSAEVGIAYVAVSKGLEFKPRVSVRLAHIDFQSVNESGGNAALRFNLGNVNSVQSRAGATLSSRGKGARAYISANYVREDGNSAGAVEANFVTGVGTPAVFLLPSTDRNWAELSAGLSIGQGPVTLSIAGDTTVWRSDIRNWTARGKLSVRF